MMMKEVTQVEGKNEEVQIKKRKQEVPAIMKMRVEAPKAMIKNQGNMNQKMAPGVQEDQIMSPILEAQDNQTNEVQSKTVDHQIQTQEEIKEEMMKIPVL